MSARVKKTWRTGNVPSFRMCCSDASISSRFNASAQSQSLSPSLNGSLELSVSFWRASKDRMMLWEWEIVERVTWLLHISFWRRDRRTKLDSACKPYSGSKWYWKIKSQSLPRTKEMLFHMHVKDDNLLLLRPVKIILMQNERVRENIPQQSRQCRLPTWRTTTKTDNDGFPCIWGHDVRKGLVCRDIEVEEIKGGDEIHILIYVLAFDYRSSWSCKWKWKIKVSYWLVEGLWAIIWGFSICRLSSCDPTHLMFVLC